MKRCARCGIKEKTVGSYCRECNNERLREWYLKNREYKIRRSKEYQLKTNYASEKTVKERKVRKIKRETRKKYPLKNKRCKFCGKKATEHHHNTIPPKVHEFNYICHKCHTLKNRELKNCKEVKNGKVKRNC